MNDSYVNVDLKLNETMPSIEQILAAINKSFADIEKIYVGATYGCRCGCLGNYHDIGSRGAKLAYSRLVRLMTENKFIKWKDIDYTNADCYLDIPYITMSGDERSICLYFKDDVPEYSDDIANEYFRKWTSVEAC